MRGPPSTVALALAAVLSLTGCATMRGRADDALERGEYAHAVALYGQLLARDPSDARVNALLTRAERGLLDQALAASDAAAGQEETGALLDASLHVLTTRDKLRPGAVDAARAARVAGVVARAQETIRALVHGNTEGGRALAARAALTSVSVAQLTTRSELGALGAELSAEVAAAGVKSCARASAAAGGQPFALELVAAYCKEFDGPMPAWKPRPFLVRSVVLSGGVSGTPADEHAALERAVVAALERSVWYSSAASASATASLEGAIRTGFTAEPVELTASWSERVPYQAVERYQESTRVPYVQTETYTESVPYTAFESRSEPCAPPRTGSCTTSHPVTRYRSETRTRTVQRFRTEYHERTRPVTRYRDEPRVFPYAATKHAGVYASRFFVRMVVAPELRPVEASRSFEDTRVAYEHDAEFAPAGVRPQTSDLIGALAFREQERKLLTQALARSLDEAWASSFCHERTSSLEEAARCARLRPKPAPRAVQEAIGKLFGDDPALVLALPRPGEGVH